MALSPCTPSFHVPLHRRPPYPAKRGAEPAVRKTPTLKARKLQTEANPDLCAISVGGWNAWKQSPSRQRMEARNIRNAPRDRSTAIVEDTTNKGKGLGLGSISIKS